MSTTLVTLKLTGTRALITHNERLANPLDPGTRKLKTISKGSNKTIEQIEELARLEWELGQYRDAKGPVMPSANVRKAIVEAARESKHGKAVATTVTPEEEHAALQYNGPRDLDAMWTAGTFVDQRTVVVGRQRVLRTRPRYQDWAATLTFAVDAKYLDPEKLLEFAQLAGRRVGLGEMRPAKGGFFGRFRAELVG